MVLWKTSIYCVDMSNQRSVFNYYYYYYIQVLLVNEHLQLFCNADLSINLSRLKNSELCFRDYVDLTLVSNPPL